MPIIKQFRSRSVSIPNDTAQNLSLSICALGALTRMASYSDNYEFKLEWLQQSWGMGRDKVRAILHELREAGHLRIVPARAVGGMFAGQEWYISTQPDFLGEIDRTTDFQEDGDRTTENPSDGEPEGRSFSSSLKKEEKVKKEEKGKKREKIAEAAPSDHARGMELLRRKIGPIPDGAAQAGALKWMLDNGATIEQIDAELTRQIADYSQSGYRASFLTVKKTIFSPVANPNIPVNFVIPASSPNGRVLPPPAPFEFPTVPRFQGGNQ